jgi:hypothetical protein
VGKNRSTTACELTERLHSGRLLRHWHRYTLANLKFCEDRRRLSKNAGIRGKLVTVQCLLNFSMLETYCVPGLTGMCRRSDILSFLLATSDTCMVRHFELRGIPSVCCHSHIAGVHRAVRLVPELPNIPGIFSLDHRNLQVKNTAFFKIRSLKPCHFV